MDIFVKCYASLAHFMPPDGVLRNIGEKNTVQDIQRMLDIPCDDVCVIFVNGVQRDADTVVHHNDTVGFFPAVGGG